MISSVSRFELLSPLATERDITLRLCQATGTVRADERRLRQVVINLTGSTWGTGSRMPPLSWSATGPRSRALV
jgi:hypothetical protein